MKTPFEMLVDYATDATTLEEIRHLAYISFEFLEKEEFYEFTKYCHKRYDEIHQNHIDSLKSLQS